MAKQKTAADWEAAEKMYRTGQYSNAEIARQIGVHHNTVSSRAKRYGWQRDLSRQVRDTTEAKLVGGGNDAQAVDEASEIAAAIIRHHRQELGDMRGALTQLIRELRAGTEYNETLKAAVMAAMDGEDIGSKEINNLLGALTLPNRASSANQLASSLTKIVAAERAAYNLDDQRSEQPYEQLLREILHGG